MGWWAAAAAGTGVRQGEAFVIVLPNVDLVEAQLRVDRQVVLRAGCPPTFAPPKTDASVRTIPLSGGVVAVLVEHLHDYPSCPVSPERAEVVFTTAAGELLRRNRFDDLWRAAVRRAGVRPDLTWSEGVEAVSRPVGGVLSAGFPAG